MFKSYQAVSIRHPGRCCRAVKEVESMRFLSEEAPDLPLRDCSNPQQCRCRYKHHTDRRDDEARRDTDAGLPERSFFGANKRERPGRRTSDVA